METKSIEDIIRDHLEDMFGHNPRTHQSYCMFPEEDCTCKRIDNLSYDTELISDGYIDSFSMVGVLIFVEKRFGIEVPDRDATPDNFNTVRAIAELVKKHL